MKKIVSIFICACLLLSINIIAFAKNPVELSISNTTVYAGDEFELKLFISDNSQMSGAVIDINYDSDMLEFVSAEAGGILDSNATTSIKNFSNKSYVRFTYMSPSSSVTAEGILLIVKFKAIETAYGESVVRISIPHEKDFVNSDLEEIEYKVKNSTVNIVNQNISTSAMIEDSTSSNNIESSSNLDITESTSANIEDSSNEKGDDLTFIIVIIATGVVILIGTVGYVIYDKNKKQRGNG